MEAMMTGAHVVRGLAAAALLTAVACGGGGYGGGNTPTGPSGGSSGQSGAIVTFGTNGASPAQVTISVGQSVTFTNTSSEPRNIFSDPHPVHTDCTALNSVGQLAPGQSKQSGAFTSARTCGFHDHDVPNDASLRGTITIR